MSTHYVRSFGAAGDLIGRQCKVAAAELQAARVVGNRESGELIAGMVAAAMGGPQINLRGGAGVARVEARPTASRAYQVSLAGPASGIVEGGARAHSVGVGGQRMRIGNDWVTGPIPHPGSPGKHPFRKGEAVAIPALPRIYGKNVEVALRKAF